MTTINLQSLERHPTGDQLVTRLDSTRVVIDTRGDADVRVEDGEEVVRVTLDDYFSIDEVDVLGGQ